MRVGDNPSISADFNNNASTMTLDEQITNERSTYLSKNMIMPLPTHGAMPSAKFSQTLLQMKPKNFTIVCKNTITMTH